jgi:hypothetical protein
MDTKSSARYNVAEIAQIGSGQTQPCTVCCLLHISVLCTGSCFDGRCVADTLIIVVFVVAVINGNEAFDHSTRK